MRNKLTKIIRPKVKPKTTPLYSGHSVPKKKRIKVPKEKHDVVTLYPNKHA